MNLGDKRQEQWKNLAPKNPLLFYTPNYENSSLILDEGYLANTDLWIRHGEKQHKISILELLGPKENGFMYNFKSAGILQFLNENKVELCAGNYLFFDKKY